MTYKVRSEHFYRKQPRKPRVAIGKEVIITQYASRNTQSAFDCTSKILSNEKIAEGHLKLILSCPKVAHSMRPGQFVMVRIDNQFDPLLRRPFSVYRTRSDQLEIVYQVVGRGTKILSAKSPVEKLQVLGPLGNGFTISPELVSKAILVAGGVGVASLMMLAVELRKRGVDIIALIGAANKDRLIGVDDLTEIGAKVLISTEDGSAGYHGLVTELLKKELRRGAKGQKGKMRHALRTTQSPITKAATPCKEHQSPITNLFVYACGPYGMLKSVAKIALENDIPAQISFESHMACGLGACLGCVIKVKANDRDDRSTSFEYKRVCKDGPVFDAKEVSW